MDLDGYRGNDPLAFGLRRERSAEAAAQLLYEQIVVNYGVPEEIMSDRGRNFLARELKGFIDLLSIKHLKTSAYHPREETIEKRIRRNDRPTIMLKEKRRIASS
jgi:transposase-like protein